MRNYTTAEVQQMTDLVSAPRHGLAPGLTVPESNFMLMISEKLRSRQGAPNSLTDAEVEHLVTIYKLYYLDPIVKAEAAAAAEKAERNALLAASSMQSAGQVSAQNPTSIAYQLPTKRP